TMTSCAGSAATTSTPASRSCRKSRTDRVTFRTRSSTPTPSLPIEGEGEGRQAEAKFSPPLWGRVRGARRARPDLRISHGRRRVGQRDELRLARHGREAPFLPVRLRLLDPLR